MTFLIIVHFLVILLLIVLVLLQAGKGAEIGTAFGGGSAQTIFGGPGPATFITRLTWGLIVLFMITSFSLAFFRARFSTRSVVEDLRPGGRVTSVTAPEEVTSPGSLTSSTGSPTSPP
jgi:preprotein translocase subunit SecG